MVLGGGGRLRLFRVYRKSELLWPLEGRGSYDVHIKAVGHHGARPLTPASVFLYCVHGSALCIPTLCVTCLHRTCSI